MSTQYRVHWWRLSDGYRDSGEGTVALDVGLDWVRRMNAKYPDIIHWLEAAGVKVT